MKKISTIGIFFFFIFNNSIISQITISRMFSDHAILQRGVDIPVFGTGSYNEKVIVEFKGGKYKAKVDRNGKWKAVIPKQEAGGPFELVIYSSGETKIINDILIGDIWIAGGQSNMEWYVEGAKDAEEEIENAYYPEIRIFDIAKKMSTVPLDELKKGEWNSVTSESICQFSAIGYFFGRNLHKNLNIPIGIINDNWGGTVIQTWMSKSAFIGLPEYEKELGNLKNIDLEKQKIEGKGVFNDWLSDFYNLDKGIENDKYIWASNENNFDSWKKMKLPKTWELSGEKNLINKDGVLWFQRYFNVDVVGGAEEVMLSLGAIDDSDKVWINGVLVGDTYNKYNKNRRYLINSNVLKVGKNSIVIRVEDYTGAGGFTSDEDLFYISIGDKKVNLFGNWRYKVGMFTKEPLPKNIFGPNIFPSLLYNGMIHPIKNFPIKGVIWYQGESNVYNAGEYTDLMKRWISDWRQVWTNKNIPFIWVQLANYGIEQEVPDKSLWAELREAQDKALSIENTFMVTAVDIGEGDNIHPKNKQEVALRLSNTALNKVYDKFEVTCTGPKYKKSNKKGNFIIVTFDNKEYELVAKDKYGYLKGFTIAGMNRKFHWAKAYIIGKNKIKVWSDDVINPEAVRYSWQDNPEDSNLFSKNDLPVFPFRTDNWELE